MPDVNDAHRAGGPEKVIELKAKRKPVRRETPAQKHERFAEGAIAEEIAKQRHRLRYSFLRRKWMQHDGKRWLDDGGAGAAHEMREIAMRFYEAAASGPDPESRKRSSKLAQVADSAKGRRAALEIAQAEERMDIVNDEFDRDPWLLNVENGTLELADGKARLREHRPDDFLRKVTLVPYDENAKAPTWEAFLHRIMVGNNDLIGYLQRLAGYGATGIVREHVLPVFYGIGRNGKGTFIRALQAVLGPYMNALPEGMLVKRKYSPHPSELMTLLGLRLAVSSEVDKQVTLSEFRVKALTGGDRIQARGMFKDFGDGFDPTHKIVLLANHKPKIVDPTPAMWERIALVPFTQVIGEKERDLRLDEKLRAEAPGILAWVVRGCLDWQLRGLDPPDAVRIATNAYRHQENIVTRFVAECCDTSPDLSGKIGDLYTRFTSWLVEVQDDEESDEPEMSKRAFAMTLAELGFPEGTGSGGVRIRHGLALKPDQKAQDRRFGGDD